MERIIPNPIGGGGDMPPADPPTNTPEPGKNDGGTGGGPENPGNAAPNPQPTPGPDVDPALKNIVEQHGNDPLKLAKAKQSTDVEFGNMRDQSLKAFSDIVKDNPNYIHQVPEKLRDSVVKSLYGSVGIENYSQLQERVGGGKQVEDPMITAQKTAFIQTEFNSFVKEVGIEPLSTDSQAVRQEKETKRNNLLATLVPSATNLIATQSPLLGSNLSLKNALHVAFAATPEGREAIRNAGLAEGYQKGLGKMAGDLNFDAAHANPEDIAKTRREEMLKKMSGPAPIRA